MPWTAEEATKHTKKANTPKKKRQWAHVANSMLKRTGSEKRAIMAANASVAGDAIADQERWMDSWLEEDARRRTRKYDPRGRLMSTSEEEEEEDAAVTVEVGDIVKIPEMHDELVLDDAARVRVTRDGYLTAMPRVARTGIQVYKGSECGLEGVDEVRVYRPEDAVFEDAAMHSFAHKPVTLDHPGVRVTAKNWSKYAVGHIGDEVVRDGGTIRVPMVLMDAAAIEAFNEGKQQLSMGYSCDLDWQAGVTPDGEKYDAIQRNIRANHLALVGKARGGEQLKLGDSEGDIAMDLKTITVDGISCQMTDTAVQVVTKALKTLSDQIENLKKKKEKEECDGETALAARDKAIETKDAEITTLKTQLKQAQDQLTPAALDAAVKDRQAVIDKAIKLMGKFSADGKSVAEVRRAVVDAKMGDAAKGWSDDAVRISFDTLTAATTASTASDGVRDAVIAFGGTSAHFPQNSQEIRDKAYEDYVKDLNERWKGGAKKAAG